MRYKNSFFRLRIREDGTYLNVFPPMDGGKRLEINEIMDFMDKKGCSDYRVDALKKALDLMQDKPLQIKVSDVPISSYNESATITVSRDRMKATIRFYPPSSGGHIMSEREIRAELAREKIVHGIDERMIQLFLKNRQYCVNFVIARGTAPVRAKDAKIEYCFDTKPLANPKVLEDGSVDFHALNLFSTCKKGDILARLIPHEDGSPGMDVLGHTMNQNRPKKKVLKHGRNISVSEDGLTLVSEIDGNVTLADGTVFVSDTYNVAADVDASTGDIEYEGNVMIPGTVRTGFCVKAKGDIEVGGVVEGGTLIAGGNIVIKRGVQGMGKGKLVAGGDICAHFFESANVCAQGDINAGSILHSEVKSGGKIIISGKKGFIVGGEILCESYVEANSIGNKMETQTILKVGVKPELYEEMKHLVTEVSDLKSQIEENSSYLNVYKQKLKRGNKLKPENVKQIKIYTERLEELSEEFGGKNERLMEIRRILSEGKKGSVKVFGTAYRGVIMFISSQSYAVKDKETHSLYKITDGVVKPVSY
ncbi:MAG: FapA family protein [Wujia sp.]